MTKVAEMEEAVHDALVGLNLHAADIALDEARRKIWGKAMLGMGVTAGSTPEIDEAASLIAQLLDGIPIQETVPYIEGMRCRIWSEGFGEVARAAFDLPESGMPLNG